MSGTITLTAAMRANLLSLQQTGAQLSTTQLDLATGNKVNSALDNPVNFFAAQSLNSRASSLSALLDGMGQAVSTIQATNQGITSITALVNQLTSIANSATQDLAKSSTVQTLESIGGASGGLDSIAVNDLTNASTADTDGTVTAGDAFTLQDGTTGEAHTFTINTVASGGVGTSLQDVVDAINQVQGFSASIVYGNPAVDSAGTSAGTGAELEGAAYLNIVSTDGKEIVAADAANNTGNSVIGALGLAAGGTTPNTAGVTSNAVTTGGGDATDIASYLQVIQQIDQTVTDTNYQGNNLIAGANGNNLVVNVNELSQGAITVAKADLTAVTGLGLDANANSWTDTAAIQASQTKINAALTTLQNTASGFANSLSLLQTRQDFTTNLVNTLQNGASALTIADKNEEGANLLALQTQQQLGIEALSLSSQANQSVLRLFA